MRFVNKILEVKVIGIYPSHFVGTMLYLSFVGGNTVTCDCSPAQSAHAPYACGPRMRTRLGIPVTSSRAESRSSVRDVTQLCFRECLVFGKLRGLIAHYRVLACLLSVTFIVYYLLARAKYHNVLLRSQF